MIIDVGKCSGGCQERCLPTKTRKEIFRLLSGPREVEIIESCQCLSSGGSPCAAVQKEVTYFTNTSRSRGLSDKKEMNDGITVKYCEKNPMLEQQYFDQCQSKTELCCNTIIHHLIGCRFEAGHGIFSTSYQLIKHILSIYL